MDGVEQPARAIRITKPFLLAKQETTQKQWEQVMRSGAGDGPPQRKPGAMMKGKGAGGGINPSTFKGPDRPVETVSWNEVQGFLQKLNERSGGKARYRLPTEAEWEYACRAGSSDIFGMGADKTPITAKILPGYAWLSANANNETHPVGLKKPNAWGLYDMHGNVWEWCQDGYSPTFYANSPDTDPVYTGPATERVFRGGSWFLEAKSLRCAVRGGNLPNFESPYVGFRIVRDL
jgi:formylglycine-generating enzyme required for sulfatase activity